MTLYVDSSALLKRYVDESDSEVAVELLDADDQLVTGRHTVVEIRRNLARLLADRPLVDTRRDFDRDLLAFHIVDRRTDGGTHA